MRARTTPQTPPLVRAAALVALLAFAACSDGRAPADPATPADAAPEPLVLAPGDTLFDHLRAIRVEASPVTNLPDDLRDWVTEVVEQPERHIEADAWERSKLGRHGKFRPITIETITVTLEQIGHPAGARAKLWATRPPVRLTTALGSISLDHEGRALGVPVRRSDASVKMPGYLWWLDEATSTIFWWREVSGSLLAFGDRPPGAVTYRFDVGKETEFTRFEPRIVRGAAAPVDGLDLLGRTTLQRLTRPTLDAPAPTRLAVDVARLDADAIDVSVGVFELADGYRGTKLTGEGDGVTFTVAVEHAGETTVAWTRHVTAEEGFVDARVDLSAWEGEAPRLLFETSAGPDGSAAFDYGAWGGLRVRGEVRHAPERPHLVLIDVDTLRADRLGCYGYERPTSPRLDAWAAAHATVFTDAISASNWTLPSTTSMLTGLAAHQHGVRRTIHGFDASAQPIALRLRQAGYETFARTDGGFVSFTFGFDTGFDSYVSRARTPDEHQRIGWSEELERLRARRSERPVFCFMQTYQVHGPYRRDLRFDDPDAPYDGGLAYLDAVPPELIVHGEYGDTTPADEAYIDALYDAGIRRMDDVVGAFVEQLDDVFGDDPYLVIFTSDHGEELFDRGELGHGQSLHRELVDVPLIVRFPDGRPPGRSTRPASGLDIVPTLLDAAGLAVPEYLPGSSLLPPLPASRVRVAEQSSGTRTVLFDRWKLIEDPESAIDPGPSFLADRVDDPWERVNVADEHADVVERLRELRDDFVEQHEPPGDIAHDGALDEETRAELQALGYLGDG